MKSRMNRVAKTVLASVACALLAVGIRALPAYGQMADYCSSPPFLGNSVPPNVLIVLDNSGSMNGQAYSTTYKPSQFASKQYYGYFDPTKMYKYESQRWNVYTGTIPASDATYASPIASGNFLNWATMTRIEAAKKLLVGGKANPRSMTTGCCVKLNGETTAENFIKTFNNCTWVAGQCVYSFPANAAYDLVAPYDNVIYPYKGNYGYRRSSDSLTIAWYGYNDPLLPASDLYAPAASWAYGGTNNPTDHFDAVNEDPNNDANGSYIENTTNTNAATFAYSPYPIADVPGSPITSVTIHVVARRVYANGYQNTTYDFRAVAQINNLFYPSSMATLAKNTTIYNEYLFDYNVNPATNQPWTWADISGASTTPSPVTQFLQGIGVQSVTTPTANLYMRVTKIFAKINFTTPSGTYTMTVDTGTADIHGIIDDLSDEARFGLAYYNLGSKYELGASGQHAGDGGYVQTYIGFATPTDMITSIGNLSPGTWTPLAETLYEMIRYFRQDPPYYTSNSPADYKTGNDPTTGQSYDPYYYQYSKLAGSNLPDQYVPCAKSFILFLTDGESTMDKNIPASLQDYDGDKKDPGSYSSQGTDYFDDVALWGRTVDARPDLKGNQNIILYPVYMFGQGSQLLKDAAINGGFNDLNGDVKPGPDLREYLRDSNKDGVIDSKDLPLTYFEGDDGYALQASITEAIASILKRAASGTAVSVLTTSTRGVGSLVQAYFLPVRQEGMREVTWTGYAQNIWLDPFDNLREDTVNDYYLKLAEDKVMKLYYDSSLNETMAATFTTDADGNSSGAAGSLSSCQPAEAQKFSDISYLWEGGKKLALRNPSTRKMFTSSKVIHGSSTTQTFAMNDFTVTNVTTSATLSAALNPDATFTAENIVRYVRGECLETGVNGDNTCGSTANTTYRDRRLTVAGGDVNGNVWKLGDIISSTPKIVGNTELNAYHVVYGDVTYRDHITSDAYKHRTSIAVVGANDGTVHAFKLGYLKDREDDGSTLANKVKAIFKNLFSSIDPDHDQVGEEAWAYVPFNAFPYLKYLADPGYCHIYYNDLSTYLVDVSIGGATDNPADTKTKDSWRTVLIGGMSFGGACSGGISPTGPPSGAPANVGFSSFFAIDISDPANPVPLWEFSDPDLGYATTYPGVIRTGARDKNGYWYLAVGSGSKKLPKTATDIDRKSTGYVYLLDVKTGQLVKKIALDHNAIVSDILSVDAEFDYVSERIYFGTAYKPATTWQGKLVSIAIPNQDLTTAWTPQVKYLFTGTYPFTSSPGAANDDRGNLWVYAGSGKYYSDVDEADGSQQIFLGFKDVPTGITYPLTLSALDDKTNVQTTGTVTGTRQECLFDTTTNQFAIQTLVTSIKATSAPPSPSQKGWYQRLATTPTAERVISKPLVVGGLVDFLSYQPSGDPCAAGGDSSLYSLGYTTGEAPSNISILSPAITGGVTTGAVVVKDRISLGRGAPPREGISITPKEGEEISKKIQVATGVIVEAKNEPTISVISKIVHWLKK